MNPIWAMLHNEKTNRYHPILFHERPLPGPYSLDKPVRHKSRGHHIEGFDTREQALANIEDHLKTTPGRKCLAKDFYWDGEDMPAMVVFFIETNGELQVAF